VALLGVVPSFNCKPMDKKLAFIFAGQGSQYQGMGLDFEDVYPEVSSLRHKADDILGFHTREIIEQGNELLHQTRFTQPLVLLSSIYIYEAIKKLGVKPSGVLGFSLGEYTALYAASIFSFQEIVELINARALMMEQASLRHQGQMAAVIGLSAEQVDDMCKQLEGPIYPANYNSLQQTVISGTVDMISKAEQEAKAFGVKRLIKLNVSGAFHSPLMEEASLQFEKFLQLYAPKEAIYEVFLNTTGSLLEPHKLKDEMVKQIISPVQFVKAIQSMKASGYTHFVEIGPGTTLSGLIKKIDSDLEVTHVEKVIDIEHLKGWFEQHGFIQ